MPENQDTNDPLAPPEDFGAAIAREFDRRTEGSTGAEVIEGEGGASVDAAPLANSSVHGAAGGDESNEGDAGDASTPGNTVPDPAALLADDTDTTSSESAESSVVDPASSESAGTAAPGTGTGGAGTSVSAAPTSDPAPSDPAASTTGGYTWSEGDRTETFTDDQVRQALYISAWAHSLPEETSAAFAAIEQGAAVAVSRDDYASYLAWRQSQERRARDTDLDNLDVDPEVAELIGNLRDEVAALKGQPNVAPATAPGQPLSSLTNSDLAQIQQTGGLTQEQRNANIDANLDATLDQVDAAATRYAEATGLNEQEIAALIEDAASVNAFQMFMAQGAQVNPATGQVIRPPDIEAVTNQALNFALARNPSLYRQVQQHMTTTPDPANTTPQVDMPQEDLSAADNSAVERKKARAASVSNAPSAANTPVPRASMSQGDMIAAMARDLAAAMDAG